MQHRRFIISLMIFLIVALIFTTAVNKLSKEDQPAISSFESARAYEDIQTQLAFGNRYPGAKGHHQTQLWLQEVLVENGWSVSLNQDESVEPTIVNITGYRSSESKNWILLGAHYDTRQYADEEFDEANRTQPVPGANDGASGVAILTELSRALPTDLNCDISLVFFDAEDQGGINGRNWSEGAALYVESLEEKPDAVIIVDMVGDKDLNLFYERNSDAELNQQIWRTAANLGHEDTFISQPKYTMLDDHLPFIQANIPTALLIDFDYAFWHTTQDTIENVSAQSLQKVGSTLLEWLRTNPLCTSAASER